MLWVLALNSCLCAAESPVLQLAQENGTWQVVIESAQGAELRSPEEGLWSIALDWEKDWPADWRHVKPASKETAGEWTILSGTLETDEGKWLLRDAYRPENGLIRCTRRFEWRGPRPARKCTLSVRFSTPGRGTGIVLPGIIYHGNPSGASSGRVPVYTGAVGEEALFEEHRFPVPFASLEWNADGRYWGAAMHTVPSPVACANLQDQWWSLGVVVREGGTEFTLLSGPCASNGRRSVVKATQPDFLPYSQAYLNVQPGTIIEKTFYLDAFPIEAKGSGFRHPLRSALQMNGPFRSDGLPSIPEILKAKSRYAATRWFEQGPVAGFSKYPDKHVFVMGWCGQADALGYALQVLPEALSVPDALQCAQKSLDFLSSAEFYRGGFHTWFQCETGKWENDEPLSQGQAMLSFANAIRVGRAGRMDTKKWEAFLLKASKFHAQRILKDDWNPRATNEAFFIAPLCAGQELFDSDKFLAAARKAGELYGKRSVSMEEPYWGGTLDASCEDKEGAFAALQGFLALYDATGDVKYLDWARHACDVVLSYVVLWDIDLPAGPLRDHAFKTRGWSAVSPQNQHLDVFGVLIAPCVYRVGELTSDSCLKDLAILMYRSCGQLMDERGSQGEQAQQTNWSGRPKEYMRDGIMKMRGGYVESWTVFWITAHFLNAAAQFKEMGVNISE